MGQHEDSLMAPEGGTRELLKLLYERSARLRAHVDGGIPSRFRSIVSADDILQEVWIAAFRADRSAIRDWDGWIAMAARSKLIDTLRAARRLKRGGDRNRAVMIASRASSCANLFAHLQADIRTPSRQISAKEACSAVNIALAALPESRRQAIYFSHIEGLSRRETASRMGKSEAAVNSLIFNGLRQLREIIGDGTRFFSGGVQSEG